MSKFCQKCVKSSLTSDMFPLNETNVNTRKPEKYHVPHAKTDRLANSAIPYMARLLNSNVKRSHFVQLGSSFYMCQHAS